MRSVRIHSLLLLRMLKHPSRKLGDDDGTTKKVIPLSVLIHMKRLATDFRLYIYIHEFVANFLFTSKLHFSDGKIWVICVIF